jgi:hypothetical protein
MQTKPCLFLLLLCFFGTKTGVAQPPAVTTGTIQVKAEVYATGLPVAGVSFNVGGATDMALVPGGSGKQVITNFGGEAFLFAADGTMSPTPFLDLANPASDSYNPNFEVQAANGLVSLAFHPSHATVGAPGYGKFYTLESEPEGAGTPDFDNSIVPVSFLPHQQVLYEYTLESASDSVCNAACASSKRPVMRVAQPGWHHNMGDLLFDGDATLFISSGDGDVQSGQAVQTSDNSQMLTNIYGKILRIDPLGNNSANGMYGIPADNPFVGTATVAEEIYAYGLRNPHRLAIDPFNGDLLAADVGEEAVESVDRIVAGGNYGWNVKEGSFLYDKLTKNISVDVDNDGDGVGDVAQANGFIEPLFEYSRADGRSVIGGAVYQGSELFGLQGQYVFADINGGPSFPARIFYGDTTTGEMREFVFDASGASLPDQIWSVNEDDNGEIMVLGWRFDGAGGREGYVVRLVPAVNGDFDDDGLLDCEDIDALIVQIASGSGTASFDMTNDGLVDTQDLAEWLIRAGASNAAVTGGNPFLYGDANLDGNVDGQDFLEWNTNKFTLAPAWCDGDFNADGVVNGADFILWNANKFTSSDTFAVPEPSAGIFLSCLGLLLVVNRPFRLSKFQKFKRPIQVR